MFYTQDFDKTIGSIFGGFQDPIWKTVKTVNNHSIDYHVKDGKLELALPGFSKKDLDINVEGSILTISAEVETETAFKKSFTREFRLSNNVDIDAISANMENGILTIELGKKVKPKKIKVL